MARDANGNYTLAAGNPVVSGTVIESVWANGTMNDLANAMTDSLSRSGLGGMAAAFYATQGTTALPSISFTAATGSGLSAPTSTEVRLSAGGTDVLRVIGGVGNSQVQQWIPSEFLWRDFIVDGYSPTFTDLNVTNNITAGGSITCDNLSATAAGTGISANNISASGSIDAPVVTGERMQMFSASASPPSVQAVHATFTGDLSALSLTTTGDVSAVNGNFTTLLTADSIDTTALATLLFRSNSVQTGWITCTSLVASDVAPAVSITAQAVEATTVSASTSVASPLVQTSTLTASTINTTGIVQGLRLIGTSAVQGLSSSIQGVYGRFTGRVDAISFSASGTGTAEDASVYGFNSEFEGECKANKFVATTDSEPSFVGLSAVMSFSVECQRLDTNHVDTNSIQCGGIQATSEITCTGLLINDVDNNVSAFRKTRVAGNNNTTISMNTDLTAPYIQMFEAPDPQAATVAMDFRVGAPDSFNPAIRITPDAYAHALDYVNVSRRIACYPIEQGYTSGINLVNDARITGTTVHLENNAEMRLGSIDVLPRGGQVDVISTGVGTITTTGTALLVWNDGTAVPPTVTSITLTNAGAKMMRSEATFYIWGVGLSV